MKSSFASTEIAQPYAEALMALAIDNDLVDSFAQDMRDLLALLENSPELRELIGNPVLEAEQKKAVLRNICRGAHSFVTNFLLLLADKRRLVFIEQISQAFLALVRERNRTVLAEVTSSVELSEAQRRTVEERVIAMTGAQAVELKTAIDRELLGGVIIKVGSQVLDASLRGQLRRIGLSLGVA